jgi:GT2 family glycosyltransferase
MDENIQYHLILNPDIFFKKGVLEELYKYMETHQDVANIMPKVIYPNGDLQYLCKLIPTSFDLFMRRFIPNCSFKRRRQYKFELRKSGYDTIMNVPYLSGCFMFLRTDALKKVGLFDERFFMYGEDVDFSRRLHEEFKTIYYPKVSIVHDHAQESYKSMKMLWVHIINIIRYFNKWGWFFDKKRGVFNNKVASFIHNNNN